MRREEETGRCLTFTHLHAKHHWTHLQSHTHTQFSTFTLSPENWMYQHAVNLSSTHMHTNNLQKPVTEAITPPLTLPTKKWYLVNTLSRRGSMANICTVTTRQPRSRVVASDRGEFECAGSCNVMVREHCITTLWSFGPRGHMVGIYLGRCNQGCHKNKNRWRG